MSNPEPRVCRECGHQDDTDENGICQSLIGANNWEPCRCRCDFSPVSAPPKATEIAMHEPDEQDYETAWLLERKMTPEGPEYLSVDAGRFTWVTDNLKALRLARREDADALAEIIDDCERVAEHQWG